VKFQCAYFDQEFKCIVDTRELNHWYSLRARLSTLCVQRVS